MDPPDTEGKVIECRAAVAWAPKEPLSIETVQVDPPKAHEIRIKVLATGVCHTDVSGLYNIGIKATFPCIMGHAGAGIIESVGEGVTTFQPGDHVIPLFMLQCGECRFCKSTKTNLCELFLNVYKSTMLDGTTRFTCKGQKLSHYMLCSTFSEYTVVHESGLCKKAAVESTVMGWGLTVIIGAPPDGHIINVSPSHYINGHTVTGSAFGGWKSKKDVPHLVEKYLEGKLPLDDFVTHEFPLKEINEAVKMIQSSECIRCIINL